MYKMLLMGYRMRIVFLNNNHRKINEERTECEMVKKKQNKTATRNGKKKRTRGKKAATRRVIIATIISKTRTHIDFNNFQPTKQNQFLFYFLLPLTLSLSISLLVLSVLLSHIANSMCS